MHNRFTYCLFATGVAVLTAGCTVDVEQSLTVTRSAHYDSAGRLTGYTVEETLVLPRVVRPGDAGMPDIQHFETGTSAQRNFAVWPPAARQPN